MENQTNECSKTGKSEVTSECRKKKGRFGTVKESKLGFVGLYIGRLGSGGVNC